MKECMYLKNLKIAYVTKENFADIGQFIQIPIEKEH